MNKLFLLLYIFLLATPAVAQNVTKSRTHQNAEAEEAKNNTGRARTLYIAAYDDYKAGGKVALAVECGVGAARLWHKEHYYQQAFDLLRSLASEIDAEERNTGAAMPASHYLVVQERMRIYSQLKRSESASEQLNKMRKLAKQANDKQLALDLLFSELTYDYSFGKNAEGAKVFKEIFDRLDAQKDADKIDNVFQTLIGIGKANSNAAMVEQTFKQYMAWKDSVSGKQAQSDIEALKKQITQSEQAIAEKEQQASTNQYLLWGACVCVAGLVALVVIIALMLLRSKSLVRKQEKEMQFVQEQNSLKARFIANISAQLTPSLQRLDASLPDVQALQEFAAHVQTLAALENAEDEIAPAEDTQLQPYCEELMEQIRGAVREDVTLNVNAPAIRGAIHKDYVTHILLHLLNNAAEYTPEGGTIWLELKRRSARSLQFIVTNTGSFIDNEKQECIFSPFVEIKDLPQGDGLGLPICKLMAKRVNGDLTVSPSFTKGVRFVLDLHTK